MLKKFLMSLICLSLASVIFSGCAQTSNNRLFLIDISGSNIQNTDTILKKVNELYLDSFPNDKFEVVFFSSTTYLAYKGDRFSKDRDFIPVIEKGLDSAKKIKVKQGTSFDLCKTQIENHKNTKIYLFTDGFFEDSKYSKISLPKDSSVEIYGLDISNNDRMLQSFTDTDGVNINFAGK